MRRANLPLAYSEGYTPHPILNFASPLPLGFTSTHEIGDFWMSDVCDLEEVEKALIQAMPPGIEIHHVKEISDLHGDKLPNLIQSSQYLVKLPKKSRELEEKVSALLEREHIHHERRGKAFDMRPLIESLKVASPTCDDVTCLKMQLSTRPGATGRPDEVIKVLGFNPFQADICRTNIILKDHND